ncbi:chemotaxis protein CheW [Desulfobacterales bacterium HSG16]|nr:chemotaxis protein CheW [Desulfobacterales bacterium HSG16]
MMIDVSMLEDFIAEAEEHLDEMETGLLQLEAAPANREVLNDIFRCAHTIKGSAEYLGMERIGDLAHKLENLLEILRHGDTLPDRNIIDTLIESRDRMAILCEDLKHLQKEKTGVDDIIGRIDIICAEFGGEDQMDENMEDEELLAETFDEDDYNQDDDFIDDYDDESYEEDYDDELFEIFIQHLEENMELLKGQVENLQVSDDKVSILNMCLGYVNSLLSSANYMDYSKLTQIYDSWIDAIESAIEEISSGQAFDQAGFVNNIMVPFTEEIIQRFPKMEKFRIEQIKITDNADTSTDSTNLKVPTCATIRTGLRIDDPKVAELPDDIDSLEDMIGDDIDQILGEDMNFDDLDEPESALEPDIELEDELESALEPDIELEDELEPGLEPDIELEDEPEQKPESVSKPDTKTEHVSTVKQVMEEFSTSPSSEQQPLSKTEEYIPDYDGLFDELDDVFDSGPVMKQSEEQVPETFADDLEKSLTERITPDLKKNSDTEKKEKINIAAKAEVQSEKRQEPVIFENRQSKGPEEISAEEIPSEEILPENISEDKKDLPRLETRQSVVKKEKIEEISQEYKKSAVSPEIDSETESLKSAEDDLKKTESIEPEIKKDKPEIKKDRPEIKKDRPEINEDKPEINEDKKEYVKQEGSSEKAVAQSLRVDARKIDSLMNQVGELVVSRAWFSQLYSEMRDLQRYLQNEIGLEQRDMKSVKALTFRLSEATVALARVANELQEGVMKVRMLPIARLFGRYPRLVRDLCHHTHKMVQLEIEGEDTELDKMVIEKISDPMLHMIRNCVDHGCESVPERRAADKPDTCTLRLESYYESNHVVIEVADDGRGLDLEKIKIRAAEKKIFTKEELDRMSERELMSIIMKPGFSTAESISRTSGRGVGMDVVKKNIEALNGTIEIDSKKGVGTRFRIKIPLTLAIIHALLIKVGTDIFTIPLAAVEETLRVYDDDITVIEGVEVIYLRDTTLSLLRLSEIFNIAPVNPDLKKFFVVVVNTGMRKVGLVVDALLGQEETVIKPLVDYLQEGSGFSGATILGDGRISLILDVYELINLSISRQARKRTGLNLSNSANFVNPVYADRFGMDSDKRLQ